MQRILIFRIGQLGDSLVSLPALHVIRAKWPDAHVALLYDQHIGKHWVVSKALLESSGLIDEFIGYPVAHAKKEAFRAASGIATLLWRLRRKKFDRVVHLEPEMKTPARLRRDQFFFRLAGIKEQTTTLQYRKPRLNKKPLHLIKHETDFFLHALAKEGFPVPQFSNGYYDLGLDEADASEVSTWLNVARPDWGGKLPANAVGVGVGSKMQSKRWPLGRFEAVLRQLIDSHGIVPVFLGGPEDDAAAQSLIENLGCGLSACGHLSLRASAFALQSCLFYLGNDTGTMHLAVAARIRCVVIFSARDHPGKWYPYGEGHKVHRASVDCEGCNLYVCHEQKRKCLTAIDPSDVHASCIEILESSKTFVG